MRSLPRVLLGVLCLLSVEGGKEAVAQSPNTTSPASDSSAPSQSWRSCAAGLNAQGHLSTDMQSKLTRLRDIYQLLQNLRLAWENDWLLHLKTSLAG
jgi:hypothetical protein